MELLDRTQFDRDVSSVMTNATLQLATLLHREVMPVHIVIGLAVWTFKSGTRNAEPEALAVALQEAHLDDMVALREAAEPLYPVTLNTKSLDRRYNEPTRAILDSARSFVKNHGDGSLPARPDHVALALTDSDNEELLEFFAARKTDILGLRDNVFQVRADLDRTQIESEWPAGFNED